MSWQESRTERRPPTAILRANIPGAKPATLAPKPVAPAPEPNLLMRFLGKRVVVKLIFDGTVTGTLHSFSKYELVIVEGEGSQTIVFKGSCATVSEAKP